MYIRVLKVLNLRKADTSFPWQPKLYPVHDERVDITCICDVTNHNFLGLSKEKYHPFLFCVFIIFKCKYMEFLKKVLTLEDKRTC